MSKAGKIAVEVVYALPGRQPVMKLLMPAGSTIMDAVRESGLVERFTGIDPEQGRFGIFGKVCPSDRVLRAGDRVEIYRPLTADPKEVRRKLAAQGKTMGRRPAMKKV